MKLQVAKNVLDASQRGEGIVALESTVLTHGLPHPRNVEVAYLLEEAVRRAGAVPATIGIVAGEIVVGLDERQIVRLADGPSGRAAGRAPADKATSWNLATSVHRRADAGTTVATTLQIAHAAGIDVFATGGIGGVHDTAYDESADLIALSRHRVVTVSSGAKSVLNVPATLERLETLGVPVLGYGTDRVAGFLTATTDLPATARVDTPEDVAAVMRTQRALGLPAGILVTRPVSEGIDGPTLERWLGTARDAAHAAGVRGKSITPYLLAALAEASGGATVDVNVRLLEENAFLAGAIACALAAGGTGDRR